MSKKETLCPGLTQPFMGDTFFYASFDGDVRVLPPCGYDVKVRGGLLKIKIQFASNWVTPALIQLDILRHGMVTTEQRGS